MTNQLDFILKNSQKMRAKLAGICKFSPPLRSSIKSNQRTPILETPIQVLYNDRSINNVYKSPQITPENPKPFRFAHYSSSAEYQTDAFTDHKGAFDRRSSRDADTILRILSMSAPQEKIKKLDQCGVNVTPELASNVINRTRNEWEKAFTFFLWAKKQYNHSCREYYSMITILGKHRKFYIAWNLINDMHRASILTPKTLSIMIRKYSEAGKVKAAIGTFYAHKRFGFEIGMEKFHDLISTLCRFKNVKEAERLIFSNKIMFPVNTKSFNIILNGWFDVMGDLCEGLRIWKEMEVQGVNHDVYSYTVVILFYSKNGFLNEVLDLLDEMKTLNIEPGRKVYNEVIHSFSKGGLVKEARDFITTLDEKSCTPDDITYNSLLMPICKSQFYDDANQVLNEMLERGRLPTVKTMRAFLCMLRTSEEVFELLKKMGQMGCHPNHETYLMLIKKFCSWGEIENVYKLWGEMWKNGVVPGRSLYIVLIHGLFLNGRLEEGYDYYIEMKEKNLLP